MGTIPTGTDLTLYYQALIDDSYSNLTIKDLEEILKGRYYLYYSWDVTHLLSLTLGRYHRIYKDYTYYEYTEDIEGVELDLSFLAQGEGRREGRSIIECKVTLSNNSTITRLEEEVYKDFYNYYISKLYYYKDKQEVYGIPLVDSNIWRYEQDLEEMFRVVSWYVDMEFAIGIMYKHIEKVEGNKEEGNVRHGDSLVSMAINGEMFEEIVNRDFEFPEPTK